MEEDIKKIEEFIDEIKSCGGYDCCTSKTESCKPIENLIERYKQMESGLKQIYANLEILDISGSKEIIQELLK